MARYYCRWRNVCICMCTPCIVLLLLFIYAGIMVCMNMNSKASVVIVKDDRKNDAHFVASGTFKNKSCAPLPRTFWKSHEESFWNRLQLNIDRHLNPILHSKNTRLDSKALYDSLWTQSFAQSPDMDGTNTSLQKLPMQMKDFVDHMNRREYPVVIQPETVCGAGARDEREPPLLLLAIKSTEVNFKNRQAIRNTWGRAGWVAGRKRNGSKGEEGGYVRRLFLLAKESPEVMGVNLTALLQAENKLYGDILQWDFSDTFFNLTLKDVLLWDWFTRQCGQTRFVFKGDDDVFVNMPNMVSYLHGQRRQPEVRKAMKDFMVGDVIGAAKPNRVAKSKYFVPESFYKGSYPPYAGGGGVVYSGLLTKRLHVISKRVHLYPIDDVFVGMCMVYLNAQPLHHPAFLTFDFPTKEEGETCAYHRILLVHKRSPGQLVRLWADMRKTQQECAHVPLREEPNKKTVTTLAPPLPKNIPSLGSL